MARITEPQEVPNEALRELALQVAYYATLGEAMAEMEEPCHDVLPIERFPRDEDDPGVTEDTDPMAVALHLVTITLPRLAGFIEDAIAMQLEEDPEHAAILRLTVLLPWQHPPGHWHRHTPDGIRCFGELTAAAEETFGPFGREPTS